MTQDASIECNIKEELLPCPFCGVIPDITDDETIHPACRPEYDANLDKLIFRVYQINCLAIRGGCDASILGDSPKDCITKWNRRIN